MEEQKPPEVPPESQKPDIGSPKIDRYQIMVTRNKEVARAYEADAMLVTVYDFKTGNVTSFCNALKTGKPEDDITILSIMAKATLDMASKQAKAIAEATGIAKKEPPDKMVGFPSKGSGMNN